MMKLSDLGLSAPASSVIRLVTDIQGLRVQYELLLPERCPRCDAVTFGVACKHPGLRGVA